MAYLQNKTSNDLTQRPRSNYLPNGVPLNQKKMSAPYKDLDLNTVRLVTNSSITKQIEQYEFNETNQRSDYCCSQLTQ